MALLRLTLAHLGLAALLLAPAFAQDVPEEPPPPEVASAPPVALTFTPPALEGEVVLGIFNGAGGLVRTLRFAPGSPELRVDTNGYIVSWDGRDEAGQSCPGGRYRATGYVVGRAVAVEGEAFHFNDWAAEDRIPATAARLVAWPDGLGVELVTAAGSRYARIDRDGTLAVVSAPPAPAEPGRWLIVEDAGRWAVVLPGKDGAAEMSLRVPPDEPPPVEVLASPDNATLLLRQQAADGRQRVRMLHRRAPGSPAPAEGPAVSDWEVVFEREWRPAGRFGFANGALVPEGGTLPTSRVVPLAPNDLEPGPRTVRLEVRPTHPGSAILSANGLELFDVSLDGAWNRFALVPGKSPGEAVLFQGDGLLVEEYALRHLDEIAAFDAGEFLLLASPH